MAGRKACQDQKTKAVRYLTLAKLQIFTADMELFDLTAVRNQLFCPVCKVVIERDETVRGYEVTKGPYVSIEDAELEALEAEATAASKCEFILSRKSTRSAPLLS